MRLNIENKARDVFLREMLKDGRVAAFHNTTSYIDIHRRLGIWLVKGAHAGRETTPISPTPHPGPSWGDRRDGSER